MDVNGSLGSKADPKSICASVGSDVVKGLMLENPFIPPSWCCCCTADCCGGTLICCEVGPSCFTVKLDDVWGGVGLACMDCGVAGAPVGECDDDLDDADVRR